MSRRPRPHSLRREIVLWYSIVLLFALGVFSGLTFLLLREALELTGRASLRQSAEAVEHYVVPASVPRLATVEDLVRVQPSGMEAVRRRTVLITGDTVETWFARHHDVETHALRAFGLIALLLIPLTALLAALGGRMLLDRLLQPLDRLVDATGQIGIGDLSRRVVEPDRPAELYELAHSFNGMLTRLERAVQALGNFTADASHELRTPLTSIKGTVQVALARRRPPEELEETLGEVLEETESMLHLVDGLLTLARGDEGNAPSARVPVDLAALLADVGEVGQALAVDRPITIELAVPPVLQVVGSPGQLRQIFLNLVSNAVKFTERGRITISAAEVAGDEGEGEGAAAEGERGGEDGWVEVVVADTGVGIATEELPRVFDRFYRGDAARGRLGGTGLGLAIARLLVEQHGGTIHAASEPGRGSEFRVRLPRLPAGEAAPASEPGGRSPQRGD